MSCDKGIYNKGQAYLSYSCVTRLQKLHIVNYTREQMKVYDTAHEEMERLRCNTLPPEPVSVISTIDHNKYISIQHINIANL